ncbi:signal peptidase I [Bacillus sp. RG28]|uniref:Signal peptidase I n=1 Tax=Gottfriedia endophytica TaxID=2820819 RepID=A0A940NKI8_9BACI|nr:signal peptidase I [Gottfriedia endophytica]MBP0726984.1 signal peptidase I [Gottfriedia endophytica]
MKHLLIIIGMCFIFVGCQSKEKTTELETIKDTITLKTVPVVETGGFIEIEHLYDEMDRGNHEYAGTLVVDATYYKKHRFQRGEIVYYLTSITGEKNVARVVGLPGEKIEIKKGQLYIDDKRLDTFYAKAMNNGISELATYKMNLKKSGKSIINEKEWMKYFTRNLKPITVKENEVFILADNSWRVKDSFDFGPLSKDNIEGKVLGKAKTR